jgi:hypothetical protein
MATDTQDDGIPVLTDKVALVAPPPAQKPAAQSLLQPTLQPAAKPANFPAPSPLVSSHISPAAPVAATPAIAPEKPLYDGVYQPITAQNIHELGIFTNQAVKTPTPSASSATPLTQQHAFADLQSEIEAAVLRDLPKRIETMVQARLKEKLSDLLEQVLAGMTAELSVATQDIVRDAVKQGVAQELAARDRARLAQPAK